MTAIQKLFLLAASANLAWQLWCMAMGFASRRWEIARGKVLKCYIGESTLSFTLGDDDDTAQEDGNHTANILYTYKVGMREFTSKRLSYQPTSGLLFSHAIDKLHGLLSGREVDVYYDPAAPSRSVVIPGASDDNAIRSALAIVLFAVAIWIAI